MTQSLSSHSNGNFAFAQVQEQVAKAKSVQYVETITDVLGEETQNQEVRSVVVLGNDLKRTDKNNKSIGKDGTEISKGLGHSIEVFDAKKEKLLILFPEKKEFATKDYSAPAHGNTYQSGSTASLYLQGGFYDLIRNVPVDKAKKLPAKSVNGKAAVGFLVEEKIETPIGTNTWQRTYWVDSTTKLPIRIEVKLRTTSAEKKTDVVTTELTGSTTRAQFDDVITDIAFDTQLDPALFRTDPPEGWTDLAAQKPTAADNSNGK